MAVLLSFGILYFICDARLECEPPQYHQKYYKAFHMHIFVPFRSSIHQIYVRVAVAHKRIIA